MRKSTSELIMQLNMPIKLKDIISRNKFSRNDHTLAFDKLAEIISKQLYLRNDRSYNPRIRTENDKKTKTSKIRSRRPSVQQSVQVGQGKGLKRKISQNYIREEIHILKTHRQSFTPYFKQEFIYRKRQKIPGLKLKQQESKQPPKQSYKGFRTHWISKQKIITKEQSLSVLQRWEVEGDNQILDNCY